jgi:hypothetical protein
VVLTGPQLLYFPQGPAYAHRRKQSTIRLANGVTHIRGAPPIWFEIKVNNNNNSNIEEKTMNVPPP